MSDLDIDSLLAPIAGDAPCGPDLEYDPVFVALEEAAAGKPERQYDKVYPAEPPDWAAVRNHAFALATRTRDLRVAVWLIRSCARTEGFESVARALQLLHGLIERYWDDVHPKLDPSDDNDPTARLNVLSQLVHVDGLADLRATALTLARGAPRVRDLELAFGRAEALPGEAVPTEEGIGPALAALLAQSPGLAPALAGAAATLEATTRLLDDRLGAARTPDLGAMVKVLRAVDRAGRAATGEAPAGAEAASGAAEGTGGAGSSIQSREGAIRALDRVCEWIERNEPSHPAPLLIQRARRLMNKNFIEIIGDLVPDGLGQIEKLAGPGRE